MSKGSSCSDEEDDGLFAKHPVTPTRPRVAGGYLESLNTRALHFLLSPGPVDGALRTAQQHLALAQLMWRPCDGVHHTSNAGLSKLLGLVAGSLAASAVLARPQPDGDRSRARGSAAGGYCSERKGRR